MVVAASRISNVADAKALLVVDKLQVLLLDKDTHDPVVPEVNPPLDTVIRAS